MRYSKYAILLLLIFSAFTGYAQTIFTVTNKGDNGPGTLRQALIEAPGTPYIIRFDLPGPVNDDNRTIRLKTGLPTIPSNVVIDGSSQPWSQLGVSGAKIIIEPEFSNTTFHGLTIGTYGSIYTQVTNVEIYGLFLRNFANITSLQNVNMNQGSGIMIDYRATNIIIGAPGKGNVIGGTINGISINSSSSFYPGVLTMANIRIQSNLIGVLYDGETPISNITGISANLFETSMDIGGDNSNEGNTISANQTNVNITRNFTSNLRTNITIVNNKIGTNSNGTKDYRDHQLFLLSSLLEITGVKVNSVNTDLYIRKNIISGNRTTGVYIANSDFAITSNQIGTGTNKSEALGNGIGVRLEGSATGIIGGTVTADLGNSIAYNDYAVELRSNRPVKIMRNSFYCNKVVSIGVATYAQAYVQILTKRSDLIAGRATPNSEVELFFTENCAGICEGKEYIVTVQVSSTGRWEYQNPPSGNIIATATPTLNGTTSQFSTAALLENEAIVTSVTCRGGGSIRIDEPREGFIFTWNRIEEDASRTELIPPGTIQKIENLSVGQYEVIIDDGCKAVAKQFLIKDQNLDNLQVAWPRPSCGQNTFAFSASVDRGEGAITYQWINVITGVIITGKNVTMGEGTYKLKVIDQMGCYLETLPEPIIRKPSPIINTAAMLVGRAACGEANGIIKNITVTDIVGTPTYRWYVMNLDPLTNSYVQGGEVGQNLDLEGVAGGYYMLVVSDQGTCPPVRLPYPGIRITETNSVIINGGNTANTTCNNNNGAINGISITQGDTYKLTLNGSGFNVSGSCLPGVPFNITGLAPGTYTLNASNSQTHCTAISRSYTIIPTPIVQYSHQVRNIARASCGINNGSITLIYPNNIKPIPGKFHWENEAGVIFPGTSENLPNLPDGNYTLRITDPNGCISPSIGPFEVGRIPLIIVDQTSGTKTDDVCALGRGTITGVLVTGGLPSIDPSADYIYEWKNSNGITVWTGKDYTTASAGSYYLQVTDQASCSPVLSQTFQVDAPTIPLPTPRVESKRVCYATEIMLPIIAPEEGVYQMYVSKDDALPLLETSNGRFIFKVNKTGDYFIRRKLGSCYSDFTSVHIEVTNDNLEIKNTMTPNGDGMNDYWSITGLPDHADINIKVYARSGQLVYESVGAYNKPFDGRFRGVELPNGAYYYRIDLRADCNPIAGSITLLR